MFMFVQDLTPVCIMQTHRREVLFLQGANIHHFSGYSKTCYKKLFTPVESHASAVSLLKSGEQCDTKAINNNNNNNIINMHANTRFCANMQQTKFPSEWGGVGGGVVDGCIP